MTNQWNYTHFPSNQFASYAANKVGFGYKSLKKTSLTKNDQETAENIEKSQTKTCSRKPRARKLKTKRAHAEKLY